MWNYRPIIAVAVLYIIINIRSHFRLAVTVTNNFAGFILFKVGCRDLSIYLSNKLSP